MINYLKKEEELTDLIKEGIAIVDFYADWCGPCRMMSPVLEEINQNIIKVNIDEFQDLTIKNGVMSVPTLIFYKDGREIHKEMGFKTKEELDKIIESRLK